jgi:hypothetical protein
MPARILAVSAFVLIVTPVTVWAIRPSPNVGSLPSAMTDPDLVEPAVVGVPEDETLASSGVGIPQVVVRSARLVDFQAPHIARPVGLTIASIGMHAPVVPVGVVPGSMTVEVPADVHTVGWYRFGPAPGVSGSAVLIGHVDSRLQGPGAFFRLQELGAGDTVTVLFANDSRSSFEVVARRSYPKSKLPGSLFQRDGRPILSLVTCGGPFDQITGSYADNVVVFAVPMG